MRLLKRAILALFFLWLIFVGVVYALMRQPPERFAAAMAKMPGPAFMLFPFETLWFSARAGHVNPGDLAPDFRLSTLDRTAQVDLASFRGKQPVVLIFGSYT